VKKVAASKDAAVSKDPVQKHPAETFAKVARTDLLTT
jgi:hypothetical protein